MWTGRGRTTTKRASLLWRVASTVLATASLSCALALAGENLDNYPLKVEVVAPLEAKNASSGTPSGTFGDGAVAAARGFGRGNVAKGQAVRALDFIGVCDVKIGRSPEGRHYPAKWLEPQRRLRMRIDWGLRGESSECDLDATVHDGVYVEQGGRVELAGQAQLASWRAAADAAAREVADRAGYPVTLFVLNGNAADAPSPIFGVPVGVFKGFGQGDVFEGPYGHGVHFTYECIDALKPGRRYPARWLEERTRLEVLISSVNHPNRYFLCEAATDVRPEFYVNLSPAR